MNESNDTHGAQQPLKFVDKQQHINISGIRLPHWSQTCCTQFVTFRLADSLPQTKLREYQQKRAEWLNNHPKPWDEETIKEYGSTFDETMERWIDAGYGECLLQYPEVRKVVADALLHNDGTEYDLHAMVIMPNHVHILLSPHQGFSLQTMMGSCKQFAARKVNKLLDRRGALWERECFDHMIRNQQDYAKKLEYIVDNPRHLPIGTYTLLVK